MKRKLGNVLCALLLLALLAACGSETAPQTDQVIEQHRPSISEPGSRNDVSDEETSGEPVSTPEPDPQPVEPDSTFLPSLSLYMGRSGTTLHSGNATYIQVGKLPYEIRETLEAELLALLDRDRYQLELANSWQDDFLFPETVYEYVYTGSNPDIELYQKDGTEYSYHVKLVFTSFPKSETFHVVLYYTGGFTLEDPGVYPSVDIPGGSSASSGSSGSSGGSNVAEFAKQDCFTCHGSGDCPNCNGYGYYKKNGIKYDCTRCSYGKCPTCGGTGKR